MFDLLVYMVAAILWVKPRVGEFYPDCNCIEKRKNKISYFPPYLIFFLFRSHWFIWPLSPKFHLAFPREHGPNTSNCRGDGESLSFAVQHSTERQCKPRIPIETERTITLQHNTSEASGSQCLKVREIDGRVRWKGGCNKHRCRCISHCSDIVMFSLACNKPFVCVWPLVLTEIHKGQTGLHSTNKCNSIKRCDSITQMLKAQIRYLWMHDPLDWKYLRMQYFTIVERNQSCSPMTLINMTDFYFRLLSVPSLQLCWEC